MDVLGSRILLRPRDSVRSQAFYRDTLGLAIYRQFGDPSDPGLVFFLGGGFLEIARAAPSSPEIRPGFALWLQVRDLAWEYARLRDGGARIVREPRREIWGLDEMWVEDPDGVAIVLVEVPADHPLRLDNRSL
jgi:catechol 2,3-dioxygenase-like lactoylglutathione lyase family enzyme